MKPLQTKKEREWRGDAWGGPVCWETMSGARQALPIASAVKTSCLLTLGGVCEPTAHHLCNLSACGALFSSAPAPPSCVSAHLLQRRYY